jgi:hypothetical protein
MARVTGEQNTGTPTVRHAHFKYAGDDTCGNNNWPALVVTQDADLTGLRFENIAGHAILVSLDECPANACDQEFIDWTPNPSTATALRGAAREAWRTASRSR